MNYPARSMPAPQAITVVLLGALVEERQAVRSLLTGPYTWVHPAGSRYHIYPLPTHSSRLVLGSTGRGNRSAAALTERAITTFKPTAVLVTGIAGGLRTDVQLGDVVVGTEVYAIHDGRDDRDRFRPRPRSWEASHWLLQLAEQVSTDRTWARRVSAQATPRIHFGAIAAGDVLLNATHSLLAHQLHDRFGDAVAIDTEDAGSAQASHLHLGTPILTIRGISDLTSVDKNITDRAGWRAIAAAHAAAFAVAVAEMLTVDVARHDLVTR